jgi:divalent metal cation (Fe/Co/Zn/Cd) transporter
MDGAASVVIGIILGVVAVFLAYESKGLLVGEGANPRTIQSIRRIAGEDPAVARVVRSLTMHFGPQEVLLTLELQFRQALSSPEVTAAIERVDRAIRTAHPEIEHVFIEAQSIPDPHRREEAADST